MDELDDDEGYGIYLYQYSCEQIDCSLEVPKGSLGLLHPLYTTHLCICM
jgi:hypothetical protein